MKTFINSLAILLLLIAPQAIKAQDCEPCDIEVNENGFAEDLIQAAYHSILYKTSSGFAVSGKNAGSLGSSTDNLLTLTDVNIANTYNYTGFTDDIRFATLGTTQGNGSGQFIAVASDGDIIAWGYEGYVLDDALTANSSFGQTSLALPSGVAVSDIKEFVATYELLALLTNSGVLYTTGSNPYLNASTTTWNTQPLANVEDVDVAYDVIFAKTTAGDLYTWGEEIFQGNNTGDFDSTTPVLMTNPLPVGVSIVQIAVSSRASISFFYSSGPSSYRVLGSDGKIYVLGDNEQGQLGIGNTTEQTGWVNVRNQTNTADLTNVVFISALDNTATVLSTSSAIIDDGSVLMWGSNDFNMIGGNSNTVPETLPNVPNGFILGTDIALYVENGGHITPLIVAVNGGTVGNVGHNSDGAFGDGTSLDRSSYEFNQIVGTANLCIFDETPDQTDTDGDGVINSCDLDDDNDGILDTIEAGSDPTADADSDGTPDYLDTDFGADANGDGVVDSFDTDSDGTPDHLDYDSDNDGCPDADEAYRIVGIDSNGDGTYGGVITLADVDANGLVTVAGVTGSTYSTAPYITTSPAGYTFQIATSQTTLNTALSNQSASIGSSVTFTAVASVESTTTFVAGVPNYTVPPATDVSTTLLYFWQVDSGSGFNTISNGGIYSGATTASLTLTGVTAAEDNNVYQLSIVSFDNVCATSIIDNATLTVTDPCDAAASGNLDTDNDGVSDICDLDDDNDGILDTVEDACISPPLTTENFQNSALDLGGTTVVNPFFPTGWAQLTSTTYREDFDEELRSNDSFWNTVPSTMSWSTQTTALFTSRLVSSAGFGYESVTTTITGLIPGETYVWSFEAVANAVNGNASTNAVLEVTFDGVSGGTYNLDPQNPIPAIYDFTFTADADGESVVVLFNGDGATGGASGNPYFMVLGGSGNFSRMCTSDFDGDGIINSLDLDSDNDGCYDAIEGAGSFIYTNLTSSNNLADDDEGSVDIDGIPTNTGSPQGIGTSQNVSTSPCCDVSVSGFADYDSDNVADSCDLDNDNDGILDAIENPCTLAPSGTWSIDGTTMTGAVGSTGISIVPTIVSGDTDIYQITNGTFNTTNFWSDPTIAGSNTIQFRHRWDSTPESNGTPSENDAGIMTVTINFSQPLYELNLNIDRLGGAADFGGNYISNSSEWTLTTPNVVMEKLSGNPQLKVLNNKFYRDAWVNLGATNPGSNANNTTGSAAGTIKFNAIDNTPITSLTFSLTGIGPEGVGRDEMELIFELCNAIDTDGDTIPDYLDLDSDGDGCADAIEGAGSYVFADLTTSAITVGSTSVQENLGTSSNSDGTPTAGTQGIGTSQDGSAQSTECLCDAASPLFADYDNDGYADYCDLDDDNDGILDAIENPCTPATTGAWSGTGNERTALAGSTEVTITTTATAPADVQNITNGTFGSTNFWNTTLTGSGSYEAVIWWDTSPESSISDIDDIGDDKGTGTITIAFSNSVTNPVLNIDRIGGAGGGGGNISNSLELTLTSGETLTRLSGTSDFEVTSTTIRKTPDIPNVSGQEASDGITTGTAAGSVRINGTFTSITFSFTGVGIEGLGADGIEFILSEICPNIDTDGDTIPDYLDLDSDGDGCPDAVEGDGSYTSADLFTDTNIAGGNTNVQTNLGNTSNSDGTPDVGSAQGIGASQDVSDNDACCSDAAADPTLVDTDNDNIADFCDLDDDNDGILDTDECTVLTNLISNGDFQNGGTDWTNSGNWIFNNNRAENFQNPTNPPRVLSQTLTNLNGAGGVVTLEFDIHSNNVNDQSSATTGVATLEFYLDGTLYVIATNDNTNIGKLTTANGASVSSSTFIVSTNRSQLTSVVATFPYSGADTALLEIVFTVVSGGDDFRIDNIELNAMICDYDTDGIYNHLDLDSDGDGCPDAVEGDGSYTSANLFTDTNIAGGNTNVQTNLGNTSNSDGTPDVGSTQGIGASQDVSDNDACCSDAAADPTLVDTDNDNIADFCDLDDDNDGILDTDECYDLIDDFNAPLWNYGTGNGADASGSGTLNGVPFTMTFNLNGGTKLFSSTNKYTSNSTLGHGGNPGSLLLGGPDVNNMNGESLTINFDSPISVILGFDHLHLNIDNPRDEWVFDTPADEVVSLHSGHIMVGSAPSIQGVRAENNAVGRGVSYFKWNNVTTITISALGEDDTVLGLNSMKAFCDTDGDSVPNYLDDDSDNDGCSDADEAYGVSGTDTNNDGTYGGVITSAEVDGDGKVSSASYTTGVVTNVITGTQVDVDATALINKTVATGSSTSFTITAATAISTAVYIGTAPNTLPDYTNVSATDVSGGLVYQWQRNGTDIDGAMDSGVYSDFNTDNLIISDVTSLDGNVYNLVITHPNNTCINEENSAILTVSNPSLGFIKTSSVSGTGSVGDVISYTFRIENTGDVTLTNVTVSDPLTGLTLTGGPIASLAPGAVDSTTITGSYTITQTDVDNGGVSNQATVTGTPLSGPDVTDLSDDDSNTEDDTTTTSLTQSPSLGLIKTSSVSGTGSVGDVISYTFRIENTGDVTLTNVTVSDPLTGLTLTGGPIAGLAPGAVDSTTITGSYTITQTDVDNGGVSNQATVTGTPPSGPDVTDLSDDDSNTEDDTTTTSLTQSPSLGLIKTSSVSGTGSVGDVISYTFWITNNGNVTLTNVTVSDPLTGLTLTGGPIASLAPGAVDSTTITGSYTITQTDVDNGGVSNQATVTGTPPSGPDVTDLSDDDSNTEDDTTTTSLTQSPSLGLIKTSSVSGTGSVGDVISYTFWITNNGNVTLTNVTVSDPLTGLTLTGGPIASLAPGAVDSTTITGSYTITQTDVDNGGVSNQATVTGTPPSGPDVTDLSDDNSTIEDDTTTTSLTQSPSLGLIKTSSVSGTGSVGDVISYTFWITNNGNVTLTNVTVSDPLTGLTLTGGPIASLAPGAVDSTTITGSYTITQTDVDNGGVSNQATVTGTPPSGPDVTDLSDDNSTIEDDTTTTSLTQSPSLGLIKTSSVSGTGSVGDVISYTFWITNNGNVTLTNVTVSDPLTGLTLTGGPIASLAPGAVDSTTITGSYTITQTDVDNGGVSNQATVTGTPPSGPDVTDLSDDNSTIEDDTTTTSLTQSPSLGLIKTSSVSGTGSVGDVISYTFWITNNGNVTLTNVTVSDPLTGLTLTGGPIASLAPGAVDSTTITGSYTITQTDVDNGGVDNQATVTGTPPSGPDVTDLSDDDSNTEDDTTTTSLTQSPSLGLIKTSSVSGTGSVGDVISYTFRIENTGDVTLTNVTVSDPLTGLTLTGGPIASLAPGAVDSTTITGSYTITQTDVDNGEVDNQATVTGTPPSGPDVTDLSDDDSNTEDDTTTTSLTQSPSLGLIKTSSVSGTGSVGDVISYTFWITNNGNVTLTNVTVSDPLTGLTLTGGPIASLAPGAVDSTTITGSYTITQTDVDNGGVDNQATVTGTPPSGPDVTDLSDDDSNTEDDTTTTSLTQSPSLGLIKTSSVSGTGSVGDVISYTFWITNNGNVTLTNVTVSDPLTGLTLTGGPIASLAPGAVDSTTITGSYTITQTDVDNGGVDNQATVTGTPPSGPDVTDLSDDDSNTEDDTTTTSLTQSPSLGLIKTSSVSGTGSVGDVISYTFRIENTGDVTLTNVTVSDPLTGLTLTGGPIASLAPGAVDSTTITGSYTITQTDVDNGGVSNQATVTGTPPSGPDVTDLSDDDSNTEDDTTTTSLTQSPSLGLIKTSSVSGTGSVGDVISYTFWITNNGNVTLTNVTVSDPLTGLTLTGGPIASLAPGAVDSTTITGSYTITQTDVDNGGVDNQATVTGTPPSGPDVTDLSDDDSNTEDDTTTTSLTQSPSLGLIKTSSVSGTGSVGDVISYTFRIENTGDVTLTNVTVSDPLTGLTLTGGPIASLAPGAVDSTTITGSYTITQTDVDNGEVDNQATVTGTPPSGPDVTDLSDDDSNTEDDTTTTSLTQSPSLGLIKTSSVSGTGSVGDVISYTFRIENTGDVTLTNVTVSDPLTGLTLTGGPIASLAPGAVDSTTITGSYTITQTDVDNGGVDNQATVTGTPPSGPDVTDLSDDDSNTEDDTTTTSLTQSPSLGLIKTSSVSGTGSVGDVISYTFRIENTGDVTLTNVTVSDPLTGLTLTGGPIASLAPGAVDSTTITGSYTITQTDVDNGGVDNQATVTGTPPSGPDVTDLSDDDSNTEDDTTTTSLTQSPSLGLIKTSSVSGTGSVGDVISYTFWITNNGNVTLTNVTVSDPLTGLTLTGGPIASLAPGAVDSTTITGSYTITQTDVDNGEVDNQATVTGTPPSGPDVTDLSDDDSNTEDDTTTTSLTQSPSLGLIKTSSVSGTGSVGDVISYTFRIENTGDVTLTNVTVSDPLTGLTLTGGPIASLAPGAVDSTTITGSYTITQTDVDNGGVSNQATVTGTPPSGPDVTDLSDDNSTIEDDTTTTSLTQSPSLGLIKTSSVSGTGSVGDVISYTFRIENTGDVTLTNVTVSDPLTGLTLTGGPIASLAPGAVDSTTITGSYTITQTDVDNGGVSNQATVTGTPPSGPDVTDLSDDDSNTEDDTTTTSLTQSPSLGLIKTSSVSGTGSVGDVISYTFWITNNGNVTLTNVTVSDPLTGLTLTGGPIASLAPGAVDSTTITGSYTITQTDVDNGGVDNQATVTGTPPSGPDVTDLSDDNSTIEDDTTTTSLTQSPSLGLIKTSSVSGTGSVGDVISYTFRIENTGDVTLTNVTVSDPLTGLTLTGGPIASLAPGAVDSTTITGSYTITQTDVDNGGVSNQATVTGTPPSGPDVTDLSDDDSNTEDDTTTTSLTQSPSLGLIKTSSVSGTGSVGDVISYTFWITNNGNVTLTNVTVSDPLTGLTLTGGPIASLAPGAVDSTTITGSYTITQTDVDNGEVDNQATVTGTPPSGPDVTDLSDDDSNTEDDTTTTSLTQSPSLGLIKTSSVSGTGSVGDVISYTFRIENTGDVTLTNVTVSDPLTGLTLTGGPIAGLAPGAVDSTTITGSYTITQTDVDNGGVSNQATVTGTPPSGPDVTDLSDDDSNTEDDTTTTSLTQSPSLGLIKTSSVSGTGSVGDVISYTFWITNNGNVTLTNVTVSDPLTGLTLTGGPIASLAPGAVDSTTITGSYTITQTDVDNGGVSNQATVTGTPPSGPDVTDLSDDDSNTEDDTTTTSLTQSPSLGLIKTSSVSGTGSVGDVISYTFWITNNGNVTLTNVTVSDPLTGLTLTGGPIASLAPGAVDSTTITGSYTITQTDVDNGGVSNQATVTGTPPSGPDVTDLSDDNSTIEDDTTTTSLTQSPSLGLIKTSSVSGTGSVGDVISYTFWITNNGNVTLTNVTVSDPLTGLTLTGGPIASLAPGAVDSTTITGSYTITQTDVDNGGVSNQATVTGTPPSGPDVTDLSDDNSTIEDDTTTTSLTQSPSLGLIKTSSVSGTGSVGDVISYTFWITNNGNVTLTNVTVSDPLTGLTLTGGPIASLAPGAVDSTTITGSYTITQTDVDNGGVSNQATVTGTPPSGPDVTDLSDDDSNTEDDTTTTSLTQSPSLGLIKTSSVSGTGSVGDVISYTFWITNNGNVTLTNVTVSDPLTGLTLTGGPIASLAPGAVDSTTITGSYTITQTDVDNGGVDNQATVTGTPPSGPDVTDLSDDDSNTEDDTTTTSLTQSPSLGLIKTSSVSGTGSVGDVISYTFRIENTGDVTLTNVTVSDPLTGLTLTGGPIASLAPGAVDSTTITGSYTITQTDVDNGEVDNQATVTGTPPSGPDVTDLSDDDSNTEDDTTTTSLTQSPSLGLIKTSSVSGTGSVGDVISYTFRIENTGDVTLTNVTVSDPLTGLTLTGGPIASLAPGAVDSTTITGSYTITQTDVDNGGVDNQATVTGTPPSGPDVTDLSDDDSNTEDDTTTTSLTQSPSLGLIKTSSVSGTGSVGDVISYTFWITNNGNVTLTNVTVSDPLTGLTLTGGPIASLAPGAVDSTTITGSYTITQTDVDNGGVDNQATVTGTPPSGPDVTDLSDDDSNTEDDTTTTSLTQSPSLGLIKTSSVSGTGSVGDVISYTFRIENTGDVTLTNVTVSDPLTGLTLTGGPIASLAPGAVDSTTITGSYTITQTDVDNGGVSNQATVTGTPPSGPDVTDLSDDDSNTEDDTTTTSLTQSPSLGLIKTSSVSGTGSVGDVISYTFWITNNGNVTLTNVTVSDPLTGLTLTGGPIASLAPGAVDSTTITGSYTITQTDVDNGGVDNQATVTGTPPSGPDVTDLSDDDSNTEDDTTTTSLTQSPSLGLIKTSSVSGTGSVGDVISYTFRIENTGDVTLTNVTVSDPLTGLTLTGGPIASLAPGAVDSTTITGSYTITQTDVDNGEVDNQATVTGTPPSGPDVTDLSDDDSNTEDDTTTTSLTQSPSLGLIKTSSVSGTGSVGDVISYTFRIENTGDVTLTNVTVSDPLTGLTLTGGPIASLAPGAVDSTTITGSYTITQTDVDNGGVDNQATVTGTPPSGPDVTDLSDDDSNTEDDTTTTSLTQSPSLGLIKTSSVSGTGSVGDVISYTFWITNNGNVTLTNVTVSDPLTGLTLTGGPIASLAPGAVDSTTITGSYTITQTDVDNGGVDNQATVTGTPPSGPDVTDLSDDDSNTEDDTTTTMLEQMSEISIVKTGTHNVVSGTIEYVFVVTNTGNTELYDVEVLENAFAFTGTGTLPSPVYNSGGSDLDNDGIAMDLGIGESIEFIANYELTQADMVVGQVSNQATSTASNLGGSVVIDDSDDPNNLINNDLNGDGNPDDITVTILTNTPSPNECEIHVYNEFSPNGDNNNDTFKIRCIENYPNNTLEVYNRWGNIVYKAQNYKNDWDAISNGRSIANKEDKLPVGTYYYILSLGDGEQPRTGWLYISR